MIICPDCGQSAADESRFCDRCGRGLHDLPVTTALTPLVPGTELPGPLKIVELLSQNSEENRYRATALQDGASVIVRERAVTAQVQIADESSPVPAHDDAPDPRAPTRDLSLSQPPAPIEQTAQPQLAAEASADNSEPSADAQLAAQSHDHADEAQTIDGQMPDAEPGNGPTAPVLGEVFDRVLALSQTLTHPAFYGPTTGFAVDDRAYLVYPDNVKPFISGQTAKMPEAQAIAVAVQLCQAVSYLHKRGLRLNDLCPDAIVVGTDGRIKLTGLDHISNDTELQAAPILNDGYTAPEIYRGKNIDKRADVFSVGCLLYSCLTGERLECESWREEAGAARFYPPYAVSPPLENTVRRALAFRPADRWPTIDALKDELMSLMARITIRAGALTDVGMVREHNEDALLTMEFLRDSKIDPACRYLYVVSDGMGGAAAGETAAAIAVATIRDYVEEKLSVKDPPPMAQLLQDALEEANRKIIEYQLADPESRGMGATAVAAVLVPPRAAIAWVGDSRVYLWERGSLRQLTKDHSLVQRLVEIGQITAAEARTHEHKNVITRSLGARTKGPAGAESLSLHLKRGDRLMLCSDGLTTHVEDPQIAEILSRQTDPQAASLELVVAANAGGGTDNISVIVIDTV